MRWLLRTQKGDGGWGQEPGARTDAGYTAFAGLALIRAGGDDARVAERIDRAADRLLRAVEAASPEGPGLGAALPEAAAADFSSRSQLEYKLGEWADVALAAQFLGRYLPRAGERSPEVLAGLAKCLRKLERGQSARDGGWGGGGWAPILQTALIGTAFDVAEVAEAPLPARAAARLRALVRTGDPAPSDVDLGLEPAGPPARPAPPVAGEPGATRERGGASPGGLAPPGPPEPGPEPRPAPAPAPEEPGDPSGSLRDAGIELYALAGRLRAGARQVLDVREVVRGSGGGDVLADRAPIAAEQLVAVGVPAARADDLVAAWDRHRELLEALDDPAFLRGFGNQGGEEAISFMLIGEYLVATREPAWADWRTRVGDVLGQCQNEDGSWTGFHCVTSRTGMTSAAVLALTADREEQLAASARVAWRSGEPRPWDRVALEGGGSVRVTDALGRLARGEASPEALLPLVCDGLEALAPDRRLRAVGHAGPLLASDDRDLRRWARSACEGLIGTADAEEVAAWAERWEALEAAIASRDPAAIPAVVAALRERRVHPGLRRRAIAAAGALGAHDAFEELAAALRSRDAATRRAAQEALVAVAGEAAVAADLDGSFLARKRAAEAWAEWGAAHADDLRARHAVERRVRELAEPERRAAAADALRAAPPERAVPALTDALAVEDLRGPAHLLLLERTGRRLPADPAAWGASGVAPPAGAAAAVAAWREAGGEPPAWADAATVTLDLAAASAALAAAAAEGPDDGRLALERARLALRRGDVAAARGLLEAAALAGPAEVTEAALLLQEVATGVAAGEPVLAEAAPAKVEAACALLPWEPRVLEARAGRLAGERPREAARVLAAAWAWCRTAEDRARVAAARERVAERFGAAVWRSGDD